MAELAVRDSWVALQQESRLGLPPDPRSRAAYSGGNGPALATALTPAAYAARPRRDQRDDRQRLSARPHPVRWSQRTSKDVYVGAVTLSADDLFYFSSVDSTLWRRNLATGRARAMRTAHSRVVISPDASGVAPAYIGAAPIVAPPYLFVLDWVIHAYRLDPD